jgi:hypothetical protein
MFQILVLGTLAVKLSVVIFTFTFMNAPSSDKPESLCRRPGNHVTSFPGVIKFTENEG